MNTEDPMHHSQDSIQPNRLKKKRRRSLPKFTQPASHRRGVKLRSSKPSSPHPQCCVMVRDWWDITIPQDVRGAGPSSDLVHPPPPNSDEGTDNFERGQDRDLCELLTGSHFQVGLCSLPSSPHLYHRSLPVSSHCWDLGTPLPAASEFPIWPNCHGQVTFRKCPIIAGLLALSPTRARGTGNNAPTQTS